MNATILDGYHIIRPLGQGTFGQTWLVEKDNNNYALKLFKKEMIRSKDDEKRILREIQALKMVSHANVISYIDEGQYIEGFDKYYYLIMDYTNGEPLGSFIEKHKRLTLQQTQKIALQLLEGIEAIHNAGLYHRDLKPDNIFITTTGEVKILDFGLVKILDASTLTATGVPMGTFAYMAPEQLQDSKSVDYRADLYSFGAILFHMLTGRIPLEIRSIVEAPFKILNEIPQFASTLNPSVPNKLDNVIATLLEKQLHRRKYTISTLYQELKSFDDRTLPIPSPDLDLKFLPRLLHNERSLVENHLKKYGLNGIVFPANFFPKYKAVFNTVNSNGGFTVIDPVVYRLAYSKFSNTQSLVNLPYVNSQFAKEKPEDFLTLDASQKRARSVIDWQLEQNPSILVAPFHFYSSVNDPWVEVDLKIFNECKKYLAEIKEDRPLYMGISIHIESISDERSSISLVNSFSRVQADGYILMFDAKLDTFNKAHYYAFGKVVSMLGDLMKPIILSRINDFGLGLMALGATVISSGIGYIEDFHESILVEESSGFKLTPKYYIPQLLSSQSPKALADIFEPAIGKELACKCHYCNGSTDAAYLSKPDVAKGHYLLQKEKQVSMLKEMAKPERLRWFVQQAEEASKLSRELKRVTKSKLINYNHLQLWIDTLKQIDKENQAVMSSVSPKL